MKAQLTLEQGAQLSSKPLMNATEFQVPPGRIIDFSVPITENMRDIEAPLSLKTAISFPLDLEYKPAQLQSVRGTLMYLNDDPVKSVYKSQNLSRGLLLFGPREQFPPGTFTVQFALRAASTAEAHSRMLDIVAVVDVFALYSNQVIASRELTRENLEQNNTSLNFQLDQPAVLEFRIHQTGRCELITAGFTIKGEELAFTATTSVSR